MAPREADTEAAGFLQSSSTSIDEFIFLLEQEIDFRHPIDFDVPPQNWPSERVSSVLRESYTRNSDFSPERVSLKAHHDSFSNEVAASNSRLHRIRDIETNGLLLSFVHQSLDQRLRTMHVSESKINELGDSASDKVRCLMLQKDKTDRPHLYREPDPTFLVSIVTEIHTDGHEYYVDWQYVPLSTTWNDFLAILKRASANWQAAEMKCPSGFGLENGIWKYCEPTKPGHFFDLGCWQNYRNMRQSISKGMKVLLWHHILLVESHTRKRRKAEELRSRSSENPEDSPVDHEGNNFFESGFDLNEFLDDHRDTFPDINELLGKSAGADMK